MKRIHVFIALDVLLFLMLLALISTVHRVHAAPSTGICYVYQWTAHNLVIHWAGAPVGTNYLAVYTIDDLDTGAVIFGSTDAWIVDLGVNDVYMWQTFDFGPDRLRLSGLTAIADTPSGRVSQDCYGVWYLNRYRVVIPVVRR